MIIERAPKLMIRTEMPFCTATNFLFADIALNTSRLRARNAWYTGPASPESIAQGIVNGSLIVVEEPALVRRFSSERETATR